jgi:hypothetical protein
VRASLALVAVIACSRGDHRDDRAAHDPWAVREDWPTGTGPVATTDECRAAAGGELADPGSSGRGEDVDAQLRADRAKVILLLCTDDHWPADVTRCYAEARGQFDLSHCVLPGQESHKLSHELVETMRIDLGLPR